MKIAYIAAGLLAIVWFRGSKKKDSANQLLDSEPLAGGDFIGDTWSRLNGADLVAQGYPNLLGQVNADPGRIGVANLSLNTSWNGTIH